MTITVFESRQQVTRRDVITYSHGRLGKAAFRASLLPWSRVVSSGLTTGLLDVQEMADRYAEQVTSNAEADIERYFALTKGRGLTIGGIPTGITELPLNVQSRDPLPSATAIASIGEALVGWHFEQQGLIPVLRPTSELPDMIFRDADRDVYYLVEAKSTQEPNVNSRMREAMRALLDYVRYLLLLPSDVEYECCAVGVIIRPGLDYELRIIRATVR